MKIRSGFVTNSSSTSFLIIVADDLKRESFFALMGIDEKSPLVGVFSTLYEAILNSCGHPIDLGQIPAELPVQNWFGDFRDELKPRMIMKLEECRRRGCKVYYGRLGTESTNPECFFCTDSFEVENDQIYFNALECVY